MIGLGSFLATRVFGLMRLASARTCLGANGCRFLSSAAEGAEGHAAQSADETLTGYDYELPESSIAVNPVVPRHDSKLLCVSTRTQHTHMSAFLHLDTLLKKHDLLVFNDTRVISARMHALPSTSTTATTTSTSTSTSTTTTTTQPAEIFLLEPRGDNTWLALVRKARKFRVGTMMEFVKQDRPDLPKLFAKVIGIDEDLGSRVIQFQADIPKHELAQLIHNYGDVPLPPYIKNSKAEPEQYQTVYSKNEGAVAAPTAGLHFTDEVFERLKAKGVSTAFLTLHVGIGTFRPVKSENIKEHNMHAEYAELSPEVVESIENARANGGRIFAVGTTTARALEAVATLNHGRLSPHTGKVNIFIYPGYKWKIVDGLITNFHLPKSTLLMMVSSLIGRVRLLDLYREALEKGYRFFSFGDSMIILPESRIDRD